jgi:hypothetical protein
LNYSDFYSLLPRYTSGGSQSATVTVPYDGSVAPSITPGYGRLFTSVAEMLFAKPSTTVTTRKASQLVADSLDATMGAERAIFFLTAHSASSELNLFGEPRVSIWPLTTAHGGSSAAQSQTPIDQLLSFDSTVAKTATGSADLFYFQRTDATSSTTDCNIANNQSILNYLNTLTGTSIPGFGGTFTDKYPGDANNTSTHQILSEIFDYVRTINMIDPVLLPLPPTYGYGSSSPTYGQNWGASIASVNPYTLWPYNYRNACGGFQVVPSANAGKGVNGWHTQGVGSFPSLLISRRRDWARRERRRIKRRNRRSPGNIIHTES